MNGANNEIFPNLRSALQICLSRLLPSCKIIGCPGSVSRHDMLMGIATLLATYTEFSGQAGSSFFELRGTCESVSRELPESGAVVHHAPFISPEEEDKLWNSGAIGIFSLKAPPVSCVFELSQLQISLLLPSTQNKCLPYIIRTGLWSRSLHVYGKQIKESPRSVWSKWSFQ